MNAADTIPPALSIHRPWTTLIMLGIKTIENRTWRTNRRGPILIHGAKPWAPAATDATNRILSFGGDELTNPGEHPTGLLGVATLARICDRTTRGESCDCGPWATPGQQHWHLTDARRFDEPIPCPGRQQLWTPPAELWPAIRAAQETARPWGGAA
jgi:hypothetical protein